ncbi:MAG: YceI family protein [Thermomicrobiales bacterium]
MPRFTSPRFTDPRRTLASAAIGLALVASASTAFMPGTTMAASTATEVTGTPAAQTCVVDANHVPAAASSAAATYTVDAANSTVSYTVQEVLTGQGDATAVGTSNALIGTLLLDSAGAPAPCSVVYVDLRTLKTDEDRRDNQVQNVLETSTYPLGTFIVTGVQGLDGTLTDGQEHTFTLIGELTVHGVTKQTSWDATVKIDGGTLTGTATTTITFGDFGMDAPVFGPVASIQDEFQLSINLTATSAA